jgi:RES domain-containing protein
LLLYRIAKTKYIRDLSGEGARRAGGRWNSKGIPVLYTADSTALATLETLVHSPLQIAPKYRSIAILELPEALSITRVELNKLPDKWWTYPAPSELARIGDRWWDERATLALFVPSSVTPQGEGRNLLLNPTHPDFNQISIIEVKEYRYDGRLFNI